MIINNSLILQYEPEKGGAASSGVALIITERIMKYVNITHPNLNILPFNRYMRGL